MKERLGILYVSGYGRSGSTLLDACLGGLEGVASLGQLLDLPELRAEGARALCSCGAALSACERWSGLLEGLEASTSDDPFFGAGRRGRELGQALSFRLTGRPPRVADGHRRRQSALLETVARGDGALWLCDSSKKVLRLLALLGQDGCDVRLIHLVRDLRDVMLSKRHRKSARRAGPLLTATSWAYHNLLTRLVYGGLDPSRRLTVLYERFVAEPRRELERINRHFGLPSLPSDADEVWLDPAERHLPSGNVMRFAGRRKIEPRPRLEGLTALDRAVHLLLGRPLYGLFKRSVA